MIGNRSFLPVLILVALVFSFYLATLAPSLNWADGARMQLDLMFGGSTYWSFDEARTAPTDGLPFDRLGVAAWDHPLYVMLGQVFLALPLGEPLYRINLMSAVFGALGIAVLYQIGVLLTHNRFIAALGSLALAVSHTYWFHSVTSEAYTLNMVFMALAVWIALRWPAAHRWKELAALAFISGLGLANHIMLVLTLGVVGLFIITTISSKVGLSDALVSNYERNFDLIQILSPDKYRSFLRQLGFQRASILVLLFVIGFSPWLIQFLRMARVVGVPLTLQVAAGYPWLGQRLGFASWGDILINLLNFGGWLIYQFTPFGVAVGLYGFWHLRRKRPGLFRFIVALIGVHVMFSANYRLADQFNFHLPSYFAFSLAVICGLNYLWSIQVGRLRPAQVIPRVALQAGATALVLLPVGLYALVPSMLRAAGLTEAKLGVPPVGTGSRDALAYFLDPNSHGDDSAYRFARDTLAQVGPSALIFTPKPSDQETYVVLRYVQLIENVRPDVHIELMLFDPIDDIAEAILVQARSQVGCRPLYLASLNPITYPLEEFEKEYTIKPEANLYRLLPRTSAVNASNCPDVTSRWADVPFDQLIRLAMRR